MTGSGIEGRIAGGAGERVVHFRGAPAQRFDQRQEEAMRTLRRGELPILGVEQAFREEALKVLQGMEPAGALVFDEGLQQRQRHDVPSAAW